MYLGAKHQSAFGTKICLINSVIPVHFNFCPMKYLCGEDIGKEMGMDVGNILEDDCDDRTILS